MEIHLSRPHILRYWAGTPNQHRQPNRLYCRMRIGAAQRELSRNNGERFIAPGYAWVARADWPRRYHDTELSKGAHVWCKGDDVLWWLGKSSRAQSRTRYTWSGFWKTRGQLNFPFPWRATRFRREPYEALGAYKFTSPTRFLGRSNVT